MPELPEVQAVVDSLSPHLPGCTIVAVVQTRLDIASHTTFTRSPGPGLDLSPLLLNRTITTVSRRAKRIVLSLDNHATLYIHLGMTGHLALSPSTPAAHTHLVLQLSSQGAQLAFSDPRRFGKIVYLPPHVPHDADLGPEPLTLTAAEFHPRLRRAKRPLKSALLDQTLIAGLGNIYVDESLHAARLHPKRRASTLKFAETQTLLTHIKRILTLAIAAKGSTLRDYRDANGDAGNFQCLHLVYNREAQPCSTCETPIKRITLGGRRTHFCPTCQTRAKTRNSKSEKAAPRRRSGL